MQVPVAPKYSVDRQNTYVSCHPKAFKRTSGSQRRRARGVVGLGNQLKAGRNPFGSYLQRSTAQQSAQAIVADVELNAWKLPKLAWATLFALCAFLLNASHVFQVLGIEQRAYLLASAFIYRHRKGLRKWSLYGSASVDGPTILLIATLVSAILSLFTALHPAYALHASTIASHSTAQNPTNAGEIEHAVDQTLELKKSGAGKNGSESGSNGNGGQEEKSEKKEDFSIQNAEDEEEAVNNAASVGAEAQIGAVVSPASVWLPYRDSNVDRNKVKAKIGPAVITIGGRLGRSLLQFLRLPVHILNLLSFKAQQVMLARTGTKLIAVFVAGIPLCALGGILYSWASGKSLLDGFISSYGALYKVPGVTVIGEINAATAHLMNVLWMAGTFTFAIVLGVVTEDIVNHVINIKKGNYDVVAANHTLVLNWNSQTISLLRQLAINKMERPNGAFDGPVVILSERNKEELDAELRAALKGYPLEWHTRQGAPHSIIDLNRVAAGQAKSVILLSPDEESEDVGKMQVAAIMGVQALRAKTKPRPFLRLQPQRIAVQVPENAQDKQLVGAARGIMKASSQRFDLTYLSCKRDISTLLALSAVQPGVASVYCTIVQQTQNGVEFYLKGFPQLAGKTFQEVRRLFDDAVLVGYSRDDEKGQPELHINPEESDILQEDDRVIALSQTGRFEPSLSRKAAHEEKRLVGKDLVQSPAQNALTLSKRPKHIVVCWQEKKIKDLLRSLGSFAPERSTVTVVAKEKPEDFPESKTLKHVTLKFVEGEPGDAAVLKKAGVGIADSIIIGSILDAVDAKQADALTVALIMLVQECLASAGRNSKNSAHIIGMVRKIDTVEVANYLMERMGKDSATAELIHPDELVAGIISQVAAEPDMGALLAGLVYSQEGSEIFLRRADKFNLPEDQEISFAQIAEICRLRNEVAIGYISKNGDMLIAPRAYTVRKFEASDHILTIGETA